MEYIGKTIFISGKKNVTSWELSISAANGTEFRLAAADEFARGILETTARIHETPPPAEHAKADSSCRVRLFSARTSLPDEVPPEPALTLPGMEIFRSGDTVFYRLAETPPASWEECLRYRLPLLTSVMNATLAGSEALLFHGCLLLTDDDAGIILTGESEIGKSTTFRRWLTAGGRGMCDDLMILSHVAEADGSSRFYAQPLPTWSRCQREGIAGESLRCPVTEKIPVRRILWLTRSTTDREELVPVSLQKWHGQLLAACNQHTLYLQQLLTLEERRQLAMECWKTVDRIDRLFSPLALAAHLQGDLRNSLKAI